MRSWGRVRLLIFAVAVVFTVNTNTISHCEENDEPVIFVSGTEMIEETPDSELFVNPELSSEIIFDVDGGEIEYETPGAVISEPVEIREFIEPTYEQPMESHLTRSGGVFYGPSGKETYYNLNMSLCIEMMKAMGYNYDVWTRYDGAKMYGRYVMIAANVHIYPKGTILQTSMGKGIVVDHCVAGNIDIAVTW